MSRNLAPEGILTSSGAFPALPEVPAGFAAANAMDGNPATWYTSAAPNGWLEIDLGAKRNVYRVELGPVAPVQSRVDACNVYVDGLIAGVTDSGGAIEFQTSGRIVRVQKPGDYLTTHQLNVIGNDITMPQVHIIGYGNSYMAGPHGSPYLGWTAAGLRLAQYDVSLSVNAIGGRTAAQMLADFDTLVPPMMWAGCANVFVFQDASNDMSLYGTSKEDAWTIIKAIWCKARALGCKVVATTHIPRFAQSFEDDRVWLNNQIRQHPELWDALADYHACLQLGSQGFLVVPDFYDETVHPTPLAGVSEAGIAAGAIQRALACNAP